MSKNIWRDWLAAQGTEEADAACDEIDRLIRERDAAFAMSRCECTADECCAALVRYRDALDTIARVSGDQAIVTCANRALR